MPCYIIGYNEKKHQILFLTKTKFYLYNYTFDITLVKTINSKSLYCNKNIKKKNVINSLNTGKAKKKLKVTYWKICTEWGT